MLQESGRQDPAMAERLLELRNNHPGHRRFQKTFGDVIGGALVAGEYELQGFEKPEVSEEAYTLNIKVQTGTASTEELRRYNALQLERERLAIQAVSRQGRHTFAALGLGKDHSSFADSVANWGMKNLSKSISLVIVHPVIQSDRLPVQFAGTSVEAL